jgi:hypothetical protein
MKRILILLSIAIVTALVAQWFAVTLSAHHSAAAFYDGSKSVEIRGVVTRWTFRNPHPFLHVEVTDARGVKNNWVLEFVGPVRLIKVGWSAKTFTPGEVISAKGHPSRAEGTFGLSPVSVSRADGSVIPGSGFSGDLTPEAVRERGGAGAY